MDFLEEIEEPSEFEKFQIEKLKKLGISLPKCEGYSESTPDGTEYDCLYENAPFCEYCLCNFINTGGTIHPETGVSIE